MKTIYKSFLTLGAALTMMCGFSSCEDYLDKDPDSNVSPGDSV